MKKLKSKKEIIRIVKDLKKKGKKIVFTNGCFDLIHLGHIRYLEKAKKLGDILIVGINSDSSVRKIKGKGRPLANQRARAEILAALEFVNYVTIFSEKDPSKIISLLKPHIHVKGGDYKLSQIKERELVKSYGGKLVILPEVKGYSTTNLMKLILKKCGILRS